MIAFWMLISHVAGDFLLQTEYEALNKASGRFFNWPLIRHCAKYTLCFIPVFAGFHIPWAWIILIFWSHMLLDRRWPIIWWRRHVMRDSEEGIAKTFWLTVVIDQVFHVMIVAAIVAAETLL